MNGKHFFGRMLGGLGFLLRPAQEEAQPVDNPGWNLTRNSSVWHDGAGRSNVRPQRNRRRQQGFLASDVGVSMYLGTRGNRSF